MSRRFQSPATVRLADKDAERARRSHEGCIRELQGLPVLQGDVARDIALEDGKNTLIPHGLGRAAAVWHSAPRASVSATTGRIRQIRDASIDDRKYVCLKAQGWGETVTVDVLVF
jgi:hypothetical protein